MMRTCTIALALLLSACHEMQPSPVTPTTVTPAPPVQPAPTGPGPQSYGIYLQPNGDLSGVGVWQSSVVVLASPGGPGAPPPSNVTIDCGNGAAAQFLPGFIGAQTIACTFNAPGAYTVRASAIASNAITVTDAMVVNVLPPAPPPPQPPPPPPPVPQPTRLILTLNCTPQTAGTETPCNLAAVRSSDGQAMTNNVTDVRWDLGNGDTTHTNGPLLSYKYKQAGTYRLIAETTVDGLYGTTEQTLVIP